MATRLQLLDRHTGHGLGVGDAFVTQRAVTTNAGGRPSSLPRKGEARGGRPARGGGARWNVPLRRE